jgi:glutathione S-transferase
MEQGMSIPKIIGSVRSSYTRVVRMVCEEKGIQYTLSETRLGSSELRAHHPFGKMPVMRHGDLALCESKAIATYLDLAFPGPRLLPSEPELAGVTEQWVSLVNTMIDPTFVRTYLFAYIFPKTPDGKPNREVIEGVAPALADQFAILNRAVAKTGYLAGDQFTFADVNLLPILFYMRLFPEGAAAFSINRSLADYYDKHARRPSFIKTIPPLDRPPQRE